MTGPHQEHLGPLCGGQDGIFLRAEFLKLLPQRLAIRFDGGQGFGQVRVGRLVLLDGLSAEKVSRRDAAERSPTSNAGIGQGWVEAFSLRPPLPDHLPTVSA